MTKGRAVVPKIHASELDPILNATVEKTLLDDTAIFSDVRSQFVRRVQRVYIPGEANPYALPDGGRTVVEVQRYQRVYIVDGIPVLYVDLSDPNHKKAKKPTQRGKRPYRVFRNGELIINKEV